MDRLWRLGLIWIAVVGFVLFGGLGIQSAHAQSMSFEVTVTVDGSDILWPPNHGLHFVDLNISTKNAQGDVDYKIWAYSNVDDLAPGSGTGNFSPDAKPPQGVTWGTTTEEKPTPVILRGERAGNQNSVVDAANAKAKAGRVYLILVEATDGEGNKDFDCTTVVVPHDMGKGKRDSVASVQEQAKVIREDAQDDADTAAAQVTILGTYKYVPVGDATAPTVPADGPKQEPK